MFYDNPILHPIFYLKNSNAYTFIKSPKTYCTTFFDKMQKKLYNISINIKEGIIMAKTGYQYSRRETILKTLQDGNGKYYHILNRVFCRNICITKVELDSSGTEFHITMDLSNFNIDDAPEISSDVLWDCFYIRTAFDKCFKLLGDANLIDPLARKPLPVIDEQKLKNMSESKIQKLKKFLENYGYPRPIDEDTLKQSLSSYTDTKIVRETIKIKDLLLQINLVDEIFLIYVFLMQEKHEKTEYNEIFCERSKEYSRFFKYYKKHGLNIMKQTINNIQLSPVLAQTNIDKKIYYYLINQNPIDAALHHLLLLISNDGEHRIKRCEACHEYFLVKHNNSKYCGRKGCTRQAVNNKKRRQEN